MNRICFYHAGCPDGFGAAWAVRRAWGDAARYLPRRHEHRLDPDDYRDCVVAFVDIAPSNEELRGLAAAADQVVVLDHHLSARDHYHGDPELVNRVEALGHDVVFDLGHSGAMLAWRYFSPDEAPDLLRYVEDQDLWTWGLRDSREVNAAIASYRRNFEVWDALAARPVEELAAEGRPIVRANEADVERAVQAAHPLQVGGRLVEAVNATTLRSSIGHALADRKAYGTAWGCVYRIDGERVNATLYSIGDVDVAAMAGRYGGGGHRNAAGFTLPLRRWMSELLEPATDES